MVARNIYNKLILGMLLYNVVCKRYSISVNHRCPNIFHIIERLSSMSTKYMQNDMEEQNKSQPFKHLLCLKIYQKKKSLFSSNLSSGGSKRSHPFSSIFAKHSVCYRKMTKIAWHPHFAWVSPVREILDLPLLPTVLSVLCKCWHLEIDFLA